MGDVRACAKRCGGSIHCNAVHGGRMEIRRLTSLATAGSARTRPLASTEGIVSTSMIARYNGKFVKDDLFCLLDAPHLKVDVSLQTSWIPFPRLIVDWSRTGPSQMMAQGNNLNGCAPLKALEVFVRSQADHRPEPWFG